MSRGAMIDDDATAAVIARKRAAGTLADPATCLHSFSWRQGLDPCRHCGEPQTVTSNAERKIEASDTWHVPAEPLVCGHVVKVPVTVVLVRGAIGDCAGYVGVGSPEWVAEHGNKLPVKAALAFFPSIDPRFYRP